MREAVRLRDGSGGLHAPPHLAACPCGALPYLPGQSCSPTPLTSPPPLLRCASAAAPPIARAAPTASSRRCSTRPLPSTRRRTSRSTAAPRRACRPPPRSRCGPASAESSSGAMSYDLATSPASAARAPPRRPQTPLPAGARAPLNGPAAGARAAWRARRTTALRRKRRGQWGRGRGRDAPRRAKTCQVPCPSRYRGSRRAAPSRRGASTYCNVLRGRARTPRA